MHGNSVKNYYMHVDGLCYILILSEALKLGLICHITIIRWKAKKITMLSITKM